VANKNFTVKNGLEVGGQEVISSSGAITSAALGGQVLGTSASPSFANITTAGYLRGPASFVIDPAAHGDDTGTVVIAGNLQVDGTQTTINSTTMTVDDLNLTLASGAANAAAANGAGITVDITGATNPSLVYGSSNDDWNFNKNLNVTGNIGVSGTVDGIDIAARDAVLTSTTTTAGAALPKAGGTMTGNLTVQTLVGINKAVNSAVGLSVGSDAASATSYGLEVTNNSSNTRFLVDGLGSQRFYGSDNSETARFTDGKLGIGITEPLAPLTINNYLASATSGSTIYVKSSSAYTVNDPSVVAATPDGILVTSNSSNTNGPDKMGLVLYNDNAAAAAFSPMLLFAKRETDSPHRASMAGIYAKAPLGNGNSNAWIDGELHFATAGAASQGIKSRMVIDKEGNVGIGTAAPASLLHVKGTNSYGSLRISPTSANGEAAMAFYPDVAGTGTATAWIVGQAPWGHTGDFAIGNQAFGGPIMLIQQNGNVGIGTTAPAAKLEVGKNEAVSHQVRITSGVWNEPTLFFNCHSNYNYTLGNFGTSSVKKFQLKTNDGSVVLSTAGNNSIYVGIGTTTPSVNLEVIDPVSGNFAGAITVGGNGSNRRLILEQTDVLTYRMGGTGTNSITQLVSGGSAGAGTVGLTIRPAGQIQTPLNPAFRANAKYGQTYASGWQHVLYDTSVTTRGTGYANSRFTAPVDGWYQFNAQWTAANNSDNDGTLSIWINGSATNLVASVSTPNTGPNYDGHTISGCCYLAATHYVQVHRYSSVSNSTRTSAAYGGWFSGFLIG